jgi:hypothetical protein
MDGFNRPQEDRGGLKLPGNDPKMKGSGGLGHSHCCDVASLQRDCSEQTAREIDQEVKKLLDQTYSEARIILREHRWQLDLVAGGLLERETLDGKPFKRLLQPEASQSGHEASPEAPSSPVNHRLEAATSKAEEGTVVGNLIETK